MITGVLRILSGNAVSQLVLIASSLVIARVVLPGEFGGYASVTAVTAVLGVLVTLRMELAIPRPQTMEESYGVLRLAITASVLVSLTLGFVLGSATLIGGAEGWWPELEWLTPFTVLIATVSTALIGILGSLSQMALRTGRYALVARRVAAQAFVTAFAQIGLTAVFPTMEVLLLGQLLGQGAGILLLLGVLSRRPDEYPYSLREALREHRAFALVATPSAVVNALGLQAPLLVGAALWGASFAGWFGFTQRMMSVPVALIGAAIGQVFIGEFGRGLRERDPRVIETFRRASVVLLALGGIVGAVVFLGGPTLFAWLLGDSYRTSGDYARSLSVGVVPQMAAGPLSVVLPLLGRQNWQAIWDTARFVVVVLILFSAGVFSLPPETALWWLGFANCLLYLVLWHVARQAVALDFSGGREPADPGPLDDVAAADELER